MAKRWVGSLSLFACFFALCVIALGSFTRLMDAGLGCPDWPGCYGHYFLSLKNQAYQNPFNSFKAWTEMIHRYLAGILGMLMVTLVLLSWINKTLRTRMNVAISVMLVGLLTYQIILGQWTVTLKLYPIVVTQHLLGGFFILTGLWLFYLNQRHQATQRRQAIFPNQKIYLFSFGLLFLLLLQIFLGAWTSTNYAGLSCPDFPLCHHSFSLAKINFYQVFEVVSPSGLNYEGGWLPEKVREGIQMLHRIVALLLMSYLFLFTLYVWKKVILYPRLMRVLCIIWMFALLQISLGIINVLYHLPVFAAVSHTLFAALLLLAVVTWLDGLYTTTERGQS